MTVDNNKHKRRWALLRTAILEKRIDLDQAKQSTVHQGFRMLVSRRRRWSERFTVDMSCSVERNIKNITENCSNTGLIDLYTTCTGGEIVLGMELSSELCLVHGFSLDRIRTERNGMWISLRSETPVVSEENYDRVEYSLPNDRFLLVKERQLQVKLNLSELFSHKEFQGVDNTGNVRVWPSEEVLTHWCLTQKRIDLKNKRICELGAGMTGLAGLACAKAGGREVLLTDGNPTAVDNLAIGIEESRLSLTTKASKLRWDRSRTAEELLETYDGPYDVILAADCLFFDEFHIDLVHTIKSLLAQTGVCILIQPRRGSTLSDFLRLAAQDFVVTEIENYDDKVEKLHQKYLEDDTYLPDLHFPVLIELKLLI